MWKKIGVGLAVLALLYGLFIATGITLGVMQDAGWIFPEQATNTLSIQECDDLVKSAAYMKYDIDNCDRARAAGDKYACIDYYTVEALWANHCYQP